jgi:hypothetical protein
LPVEKRDPDKRLQWAHLPIDGGSGSLKRRQALASVWDQWAWIWGFTLELEFSDGDLDGPVDAVINELPELFEVGDHLLQFGNSLRFSARHQNSLKGARKQLSAFFRLS